MKSTGITRGMGLLRGIGVIGATGGFHQESGDASSATMTFIFFRAFADLWSASTRPYSKCASLAGTSPHVGTE